jgi:hypothetical protein
MQRVTYSVGFDGKTPWNRHLIEVLGELPASGDQRPERGSIVMNAKTAMDAKTVITSPVTSPPGITSPQGITLPRSSAAALLLLGGHSHISDLGGQRLVSVI